jgi:flagellar hook-associated protein 3 FlgL
MAGYENILDRVKTLVSRGLSEPSTPAAKEAIAVELESLRQSILSIANTKSGDDYVFGGTRQNAPPFDPVTALPAASSTVPQFVQIEPGTAALAAGVTAESVFGDVTGTIFTDLTNTIAALRGTGDPAADKATLLNTMSRLEIYNGLANTAHATIGASTNATQAAVENLSSSLLTIDERITAIEGADFAETAVALTETQRALDATLQVAAQGRRSLFDFLG